MSEQARKVKNIAIPEWAEGLWAEGLYIIRGSSPRYSCTTKMRPSTLSANFECKGNQGGVVNFSFEMLETLATVMEEARNNKETPRSNNSEPALP
jgi:hypothetical protein